MRRGGREEREERNEGEREMARGGGREGERGREYERERFNTW